MRLLLVSNEFPPGPGGIATHAYQIVRQLPESSWDITVVTKQEDASEDAIRAFNNAQPFRVDRVLPRSWKAIKFLDWLLKTLDWVKTWKPDVLLASGVSAILVTGLIARLRGERFVIVAHGEFPARWQLPWMRWSCRIAKALVCVSEYTREQMEAARIQCTFTTVIPNGGDPCIFKPLPEKQVQEFRNGLGLGSARILITVGRVSERKGQDLVIRALPHILRKVPNTHYFAVGVPGNRKQFHDLATQLGVSDFVHFTGTVTPTNLVEFLNACDVFIMLSRHTSSQYEAYGIAVIEAALCEKPAVVSNSSGVRESIIAGVTGLAVPEHDEIAAADAVVTLLQDEKLRNKLGTAARKHALETATWQRRAQQYDELLRQVLREAEDG